MYICALLFGFPSPLGHHRTLSRAPCGIQQVHIIYLFQPCVCKFSCSVVSYTLQPHGLQPAKLLCPWNFPGKITKVGCHFLFQGIFVTQESKLCLVYQAKIFIEYLLCARHQCYNGEQNMQQSLPSRIIKTHIKTVHPHHMVKIPICMGDLIPGINVEGILKLIVRFQDSLCHIAQGDRVSQLLGSLCLQKGRTFTTWGKKYIYECSMHMMMTLGSSFPFPSPLCRT